MNRNALSSLLAGIIVAVAAMLAGGANAAYAQSPNCCTFIVNTETVPATCFPLTIMTHWGPGTHPVVIPSPGFHTFGVPFSCPPAPTFTGAAVAIPPGCCLTVRWYYCGGCLFIEVIPC